MATICAFTADGGGNLPVMLAVVAELVGRGIRVDLALAPLAAHVPVSDQVRQRAAETGARLVALPPDFLEEVELPDPASFGPELRDNAYASNLAYAAPALPAFTLAAASLLRAERYDALLFDVLLPATASAAEAAGVPAIWLVPQRLPLPQPGLPLPGRGTLLAELDPIDEAAAAAQLDDVLDRHLLPGLNDGRAHVGLPPLDHAWSGWERRLARTLVATSPAFDLISDPPPANTRWVGVVSRATIAEQTPTGNCHGAAMTFAHWL